LQYLAHAIKSLINQSLLRLEPYYHCLRWLLILLIIRVLTQMTVIAYWCCHLV